VPDEQIQRAVLLLQSGQLEEAEQLSRQLLELRPTDPDVHVLRAGILAQLQESASSVESLDRAIELAPTRADLHMGRGELLARLGDPASAAEAFGSAARLSPDWFEPRLARGCALAQIGRYREAVTTLEEALELRTDSSPLWITLSGALQGQGRSHEAEAAARRAIAIEPGAPEAWTNLGSALQAQGRLREALESLDRALALNPGYAMATYNRAHVLNEQWKGAEAVAGFRRAVDLDPDYAPGWHAYLFNLLYSPDIGEEGIYQEHRRWGRLIERSRPAKPAVPTLRRAQRRVRVGYVSPDFRWHSCAHFLRPLFSAHDRQQFQITAYASVQRPDRLTEWFRGHADVWRDIHGTPYEKIASQIRDDEIDILVDLAGHTANHPLELFALQPAPIQISWLGYPATSGLGAIGFRLTDEIADPPGDADRCHSEKLIRLPGCFLCYQPAGHTPEVVSPPVLRNGFVTFGSFNSLAKINGHTVSIWGNLLRSLPGSRLILKNKTLSGECARRTVSAAFLAAGIAADRVELRGWLARPEQSLAAYADIDIALDTFPYNGTTTTFEALWMGVPVITLRSDRHAGRVGASILTHLGERQWIASSPEQYLAAARQLASAPALIAANRLALRERLATSRLCDSSGFAANLEHVYRELLTGLSC